MPSARKNHIKMRSPSTPSLVRGARGLGRTTAMMFAASVVALLAAWVRPQLPTPARTPLAHGAKLAYFMVEIEGEPRMVKDGEELVVLRGDRLVVREAVLATGDRAEGASLVGAPRDAASVALASAGATPVKTRAASRKAREPAGDLGAVIDTLALKPKLSENGLGDVWALLATSRRTLHGAAFVKVLPPSLRYAEIEVNGKPAMLRDGEALRLKATDLFKVRRVVTNLPSDDGVSFQIATLPASAGAAVDAPTRAIRFLRRGVPFAAVPLDIRED
jgi:hypothetical protein